MDFLFLGSAGFVGRRVNVNFSSGREGALSVKGKIVGLVILRNFLAEAVR